MTTTHDTDPGTEAALAAAVADYVARRDGRNQPTGGWQRGVWLPDPESEAESCCRHHLPTNQPGNPACYPDAARRHCRGIDHVARRHGVSPSALRRAVRAAAA